MQERNVEYYIRFNNQFFDRQAIPYIRQALYELPDNAIQRIETLQLKKPEIGLGLSIVLGGLGIDRFYAGDIGMGFLKLFTAGGAGIITVYDWFKIMKRIRIKNYDLFMERVASIFGRSYTPHLYGDEFSGSFIYTKDGKYCPNCGQKILGDEDYCDSCGYKL